MALRKRVQRDLVKNQEEDNKEDYSTTGIEKAIDILNKIWERRQKYEMLAPTRMSGGTGYLAHHFFPDSLPAVRYPDYLAFPTHIHNETTSFTVTPVTREGVTSIVFYWSPSAPLLENPFAAHADYVAGVAIAAGASTTPWFALSTRPVCKTANVGPAPTTPDATTIGAAFEVGGGTTVFFRPPIHAANRTTNWDIVRTGMQQGANVLRSRLLSAMMTITPVGKPLDQQGTLRIGSGLVSASAAPVLITGSNTLHSFSANLSSTPIFGAFNASDAVVLQYRHVDESAYGLAPYPSTMQAPYYIGILEGLDPTNAFSITLERTFESIVNSNMTELTNPIKEAFNSEGQHYIKENYYALETSPLMTLREYEKKKRQVMGGMTRKQHETGYPFVYGNNQTGGEYDGVPGDVGA